MPLNLIDYASVGVEKVTLKFGRTIKISSITNNKFIVQTTDATPSAVSNPFKLINTLADYNTIGRSLTLYWLTNETLTAQKEYYIRVVGLQDASGEVVPEEKIIFTTAQGATPSSTPNFSTTIASKVDEILIEDNSILVEAYTGYQIIAKNPDFYIDSVEPKNGSFYLTNDDNNGRVIVTFSSRPAINFLSNKYFKSQRKLIQKSPSRWENIDTVIQMHSWKSEVYIDFPSLIDATPSYYTANKNYFEKGYKYRIIVSKEIGI